MLAIVVTAIAALAFPFVDRLTFHPGETLILLMPPALGALLWFGWPRVRRVSRRKLCAYVVVLTAVLAAAVWFVASVARGRMLWREVLIALYFTIAWRLAWEVWRRTVGRAGERWRRWGRRTRRVHGLWRRIPDAHRRRVAAWTMTISPLRALAVMFVFAPLVFGSLVHRIKIGNPADKAGYGDLNIETVSIPTEDGLTLSGWFLADGDSDATVIICHGAGANKGNFAEYLSVFYGKGYNALIFDFRGHGESDGHTCTFGLYEQRDVRAAVEWVRRERPERAARLVALGSSMGGMSLLLAAAGDPRIEAVVLDSCFVGAPQLAEQHLGRLPVIGAPLRVMILGAMSLHAGQSFWWLDGREAIAAIAPRPLLLIHGDEDRMIPPANLDILFAAAREPKEKWLGPGPHSNIMTTAFSDYQERVIEFFDRVRTQPKSIDAIGSSEAGGRSGGGD